MDCKEAQALVPKYIRHEIDVDTLGEFLDHVKSCEDCYEELEIYYSIDMGLKVLDGKLANVVNLKASMEQALRDSEARLRQVHWFQVCYYALNTLVFWAVVAALVMQVRVYFGFV